MTKDEKVKQRIGELTGQAIVHKRSGLIVETTTRDNGKKFSQHEIIAEQFEAEFHPSQALYS